MAIDQLCVDAIRVLSIDGIQQANSGHPGLPMGAAPMAYVLWNRHLKHNPRDPKWPDRDRFVLSGGHGSMLIYSLLHLAGYDVSMDDIKSFRQWGSKTPGHPEYGHTPGVETTTGPLGQGFATAVGMAMAEAHQAACYNKPGKTVVDHYTYVLATDGDMMEGVVAEAASLAGHLKLGKLICLYDSNDICLAGSTSLSFTDNTPARFEAYGWHVQVVKDGNDLEAIDRAIAVAKADPRPSLIEVKTLLGYGSPNKANTHDAHGSPLGKDEVAATKRNLGWDDAKSFYVPDEVYAEFGKSAERGAAAQKAWGEAYKVWAGENADLAKQWEDALAGRLPEGWDADVPVFGVDDAAATRACGGKVLNAIAKNLATIIGGSADLNPSTNTALKGMGDFEPPLLSKDGKQGAVGGPWGYEGRNHHYGIREHAMAAAANGLALHGGLRPYVATFFNFSDYLKPSLRLAALMGQPVVYVFTHDGIGVGEDGPTHQPIEQLAMLRAIPNTVVLRPADGNETAVAWKIAVERTDGPTALILSRQKLPSYDRSVCGSAEGVRKGAYVLQEAEGGKPRVVLVSTGSEVTVVMAACKMLAAKGVKARVVSMPSWELFDAQPKAYRDEVLPEGTPRVTIEAAATIGWHKYAGAKGAVIGIDRFGASAPAERIYAELGVTAENVVAQAEALLA